MQKIDEKRTKAFIKIVKLIKKDSERGLYEFYKQYGRMIYLTAKSVGCDHHQADSVINKVLLKIWQKVNVLYEIKNPDGWIHVVARNCAKDEVNVEWQLELNENICKAQDSFENIESRDSFEYLISFLSEEERSIFLLRFSSGCTFQQIADYCKKPLATITSTYYRALEKIKNSIKVEDYE